MSFVIGFFTRAFVWSSFGSVYLARFARFHFTYVSNAQAKRALGGLGGNPQKKAFTNALRLSNSQGTFLRSSITRFARAFEHLSALVRIRVDYVGHYYLGKILSHCEAFTSSTRSHPIPFMASRNSYFIIEFNFMS